MATKWLFVNADGLYEEKEGYATTDFIATSAGVADAGKPVVLDAAGHIDATMINDGDVDHGALAGLGDDDHTQYILAAGTRDFSGDQSMGSNQLTNVGDPTASGIDAASSDAVPMSFLASTAAGEGASVIGIQDSANYFVATDVEGALIELVNQGVTYTVGSAVTKGDVVYISANDAVSPYSTLSASHRGVGLAATTEASGTVKVLANDEIVTGVLTGAVAGTPYYWNGSTLSTTIPSGSGSHVWQAGVAKNATDLHVEVRLVKKNA